MGIYLGFGLEFISEGDSEKMVAPNTLLQNRYMVLNQIGQGGMGAVFIATDQRFGSTVALKETFFDDPAMRKAFEREARLLNHLRHPALPRVSDHFLEEEGQFLVMEYIPGPDLLEKLRERGGAFPLSEVLNWADQLLDALDYLHTQEPPVIHRDIKPQNLKLTPRNHIVLLDFGLAKGTPMQTKVTATGSVFGYSRFYAPLEQIQGAGTDPRSDLYSLGATLYHLMTDSLPTDALTRATAVLNGQDDPLRPASEVHVQVTQAVAEVIHSAMALNASQRPQTASAMRDALREAAQQGLTADVGTNLLPSPSTNVHEQETQLIHAGAAAAAAPPTAAREATDETGVVKAAEGATVTDAPLAPGEAATNAEAKDSVVTKVATAEATASKSPQRKRAFAIAASAVVLIVLAAAVYTFTRNQSQTASGNENTQTITNATRTSNTENINAASPVPTPAENANAATVTTTPTATPPVVTRQTPSRPTQAQTQQGNKNGNAQAEVVEPPEPPNTNGIPDPQRPGGRRALPPGMTHEEALRIYRERRRARMLERQRRERIRQP